MGKKNNTNKKNTHGKQRSGSDSSSRNSRKRADSKDSNLTSTTSTNNNNNKYNNHLPLTKEAQERVDKLTGLYYDLPYGANVSLTKGGEKRLLIFSISQMFLLHVIIYRFNYNTYNFLMLFICILALVWRFALRTGKLSKVDKLEKNSSYAVALIFVLGAMWYSVWSVIYVLPVILPRYYMNEKRRKYITKRNKKNKRSTLETGKRHEYIWVTMAMEELVFNIVEVAYITNIVPVLFVSSPILYYPGKIVFLMLFVFIVNCTNFYISTLIVLHQKKLCDILKLQGCWIKKPDGWVPPTEEKTLVGVKAKCWDSTKLYTKTDCITYTKFEKDVEYITYYDNVLAIPGSMPIYILHMCFVDHQYTYLILMCIQGLLVCTLCLLAFSSPYWPMYILQIAVTGDVFHTMSSRLNWRFE